MIFRAVSIAVERNYAGYNIDWEGDTGEITSQVHACFPSFCRVGGQY